jgi:hypothetical protein
MTEEIEMEDFDRPGDAVDLVHEETFLDLPDVPLDVQDSKGELLKTNFVSEVRNKLKIKGKVDPDVYKGLTFDAEGQLLYKNRRITYKRGGRLSLYSDKTLTKNTDSREFLRLIGFMDREIETVAPEQTIAVKSKVDSFKITEEWAKKEKDKAKRQLEQTTDENEQKKLQELIKYYEQLENQANRRYNEVVESQLKRINTIISDETRPLSERLKELFRRDGLTIGALITAIGMTISTIILAFTPHNSPATPPSGNNGVRNAVKKVLVRLSNFLLDLAKKALNALPGLLGSVVSFLLKKTGELVLFLSEHLIILLLTILLALYEFTMKTLRKKQAK